MCTIINIFNEKREFIHSGPMFSCVWKILQDLEHEVIDTRIDNTALYFKTYKNIKWIQEGIIIWWQIMRLGLGTSMKYF